MVAYMAVTTRLRNTSVRRVDVRSAELVGHTKQCALIATILTPVVRVAPTDVGREAEISKVLVDICHHVSIVLMVVVVRVAIVSLRAFSKLLVGSSINLALELNETVVKAITCSNINPRSNIVCQTEIEHIATLVVGGNVAICCPIRVLRCICWLAYRPVLYRNTT